MRTIVAILAAVVAIATGVTIYLATASTAGLAMPIDPTMAPPVYQAQPTDYPNCATWGLKYGQIMFSGSSIHYYRGCINPVRPGTGDSFTGHIAEYLAAASKG